MALSVSTGMASEDLTNLSIEELLSVEVITASRIGQKAEEAPSSVSVLTADDIHTFGWRTLAEALNGLRGLFTRNDRNYSYLGMRGFTRPGDFNSRVLLMVDGQRMNENIFDGAYIGQEFMLDIDLIDRIEYIPGSGSSIYGANAFLGMINVITKKGKAINGSQVAGEIGSFDTYKGRISYGKTLENGSDVLFSASHYDSAGVNNLYFPEYDSPASNHGIAHNMDGEFADRLYGKINFEELTLSGGYVNRTKSVPTAAFGAIFNDPDFSTIDKQFYTNLKYEKAISDKTQWLFKGFYQGYDYYSDEAYMADVRTVNHDQVSGRWWGGEAQFSTTAFDRQRIIAGLEYQYDQRQRLLNYDIGVNQAPDESYRNGHRVELYLQDDLQLSDNWILSGGARLDQHHMLKKLQLNPRAGLIWTPWSNTHFKLLYSSTFRAPNVSEADSSGFGFISSSALREEHINSYEGVAEWRSNDNLKLIATLFHNDISQLLDFMSFPAGGGVINNGHYRAYGGELEAEQRWNNGRLLKASYSYTLVTNESQHGIWANASPQNLFKLHYAEPLFNDFARLGIESIYVDQRKTESGLMAQGYELINVNLSSSKIFPGVDTSFGLYNLLDNHYQVPSNDTNLNMLRMNGREIRFKLQLTF